MVGDKAGAFGAGDRSDMMLWFTEILGREDAVVEFAVHGAGVCRTRRRVGQWIDTYRL